MAEQAFISLCDFRNLERLMASGVARITQSNRSVLYACIFEEDRFGSGHGFDCCRNGARNRRLSSSAALAWLWWWRIWSGLCRRSCGRRGDRRRAVLWRRLLWWPLMVAATFNGKLLSTALATAS